MIALYGLDTHPWSTVSHAYGTADDLPEVLRALVGDDADEAISELYESVLHQGTVYEASAEVAPFLARIAVAGHKPVELLALLGGMAESEDEHKVAPGAVRAAVAAQLPLLLPLLSADGADVRQAAAWAVAQTRAVDVVLPALRDRWEREREPLVRAELLGALSRLVPAAAADLAQAALDASEPAELRIAAVFACLDADVPWTTVHHGAVLSLLPADPLVADRLDLDRKEPLCAIAEALLHRDTGQDRAACGDLLETALRDERPGVRKEAVWAAEQACQASRSAPERLLPALLPLLADAEMAANVVSLLGMLGPIAADAAPALAELAATESDGSDQDAGLADRALAALALVAPAQAAPLLARDLGRRPRALDSAAGPRALSEAPFPFHAELLTAVRARLTEADPQGNEAARLTRLLRQWGGRAAAALPELYAALPRFPWSAAPAIAAIAAVCAPDERRRAADVLREATCDGPLAVARALYDMTGESTALLEGLAQQLSGEQPHAVAEAARLAGELGADAAPLVPALRAALSGADAHRVSPVLDADVAVATALWQVAPDAQTARTMVVPALDSVFARAAESSWHRWSAIRAARAAALLGPAGRPLAPRLEALLDDLEQAPAAALALAAVAEPGVFLDHPALADTVLKSAERGANSMEACDALAALESLDGAALTWDHLRRLNDLAERDLRVIHFGLADRVILHDERLRVRAREVSLGGRA